jgi:SAM-dependent methyltransferase
MPSPWTLVPAADYEAHMGPDGADQLAPLSSILGKALGALKPARLLVLGVATGNGLEHVDPAVTRRVVGVDVNLQYVAIARQRHMRLGARLELYCGDVEKVTLDGGGFDMAWAALLLEHVDPARVARRIAAWLAPGGALVSVLQLPAPDGRKSEPSPFPGIRAVAEAMRLVAPAELEGHLGAAGMTLRASFEVPVAHGRRLYVGHFQKPK